jgi:DNA repair protein RadC
METDREESKRFSLKEMDRSEQPREKLIDLGPESLTKAELLAILIGSGTTKKTAVELMQEVMDDCNDMFTNLYRMSIKRLMEYNGIGEAKAVTIKAAAEIGQRRAEETMQDLTQIAKAEDVYYKMRLKVQNLTHEASWVFLLNNSARLLGIRQISSGGITETSVDVRMALKEALLSDATAMILCHNHPSGSLRPSRQDDKLTENLRNACMAVNIKLIDHVIVADGGFYSYAEQGKL